VIPRTQIEKAVQVAMDLLKKFSAQTEETRLSQLQQRSRTRSRGEGRQWQARQQDRRQGVEGRYPALAGLSIVITA